MSSRRFPFLTILLGVVLIALIAPLSQFLTIQTVNADVETASPVGWAVGLVFSLVLAFAALRLIARRQLLPRQSVVILYCMLTIAVPLMNLGLVRLCYISISAVVREYLLIGNSTYRTAFNAQDARWFPHLPDAATLAWARAERLLAQLADAALPKKRQQALNDLTGAIKAEAGRLAGGEGRAPETALTAALTAKLEGIGVDELDILLGLRLDAALKSLRIDRAAADRYGAATAASAASLERLRTELAPYDEFDASLRPSALARADRKTAGRVREELLALPEPVRAETEARALTLDGLSASLGSAVAALSLADRERLRVELERVMGSRLAAMPSGEVRRLADGYVFRLTREERATLSKLDGTSGRPLQNLSAFQKGVWDDLAAAQEKKRQSFTENFQQLRAELPWQMWLLPMLLWSTLFGILFLFLMCVAEWLRRKWVERENLAFPLVEVADAMIRHDFALESAEDPTDPPRRRGAFNPAFLAGCVLAFLLLSVEAMGHYEIIPQQFRVVMDLSATIFSTGNLKELTGMIFVLSPIVLGIAFLINLEISFSIWVSFLLFKLISWRVQQAVDGEIRDSLYTGWAGGRFYPFPMDQMLGATICFSSVLLWKTFVSSRKEGLGSSQEGYLPAGLTRWGLVFLPLLIFAGLWWIGVRDAGLIGFATLVVVAQTVAGARARAETGFSTHHSSYEFSKIPMVFGMTGASGSAAFTNFISLAFLPISLLFRSLPQQLENIELARRHKIPYRTVAVASLAAFVAAIGVGTLSFMLFSYYHGEIFQGFGGEKFGGKYGPANPIGMLSYPLWVSHYFGEHGLDKFTQIHWIRVGFVGIGFGVVALLMFLRGRFLKFPLNPIGYVVVLLSFHYEWVSPYVRGINTKDTSWLWGGVFVAWLLKKLFIKYGGMNFYKRTKPFFIGLVVGSVFCVFCWNMLDLGCSILAVNSEGQVTPFLLHFQNHQPYSPRFY